MNGLNNTNILSKSMNGLNVITADEINTNNFTAISLSATNLTATNLIATGSVSFPDGSILDSDLTNNVALLNRNPQTFTGVNKFLETPVFASSAIDLSNNVQINSSPVDGNKFQIYVDGERSMWANQYGINSTYYGNGANIDDLDASKITSGTLSNDRLSANVAYTDKTPQTFTGITNFNKGLLSCGIDTHQVKIGTGVLQNSTVANSDNYAIGFQTLFQASTGSVANVAFGAYSGNNLTTNSSQNVIFGHTTGGALKTNCNSNLVIGGSLGNAVQNGNAISNNCVVGNNALYYAKDGCSANVAIGNYALWNDQGYGGIYSTAIGPNAGARVSGGSRCVFIGGCYAEASNVSPSYSSYNDVVCIGVDAVATASNQIVLGTANETTYIKGSLNVSTAGKTIDFGTNAPIMSGANITGIPTSALPSNVMFNDITNVMTPAGSNDALQINKTTGGYIKLNSNGEIGFNNSSVSESWKIDSSGIFTGGSSNICLKDITNVFALPASTDVFQIVKNGGGGYFFANSAGHIGFWNGSSASNWSITSDGVASFKDRITLSNTSNSVIIGNNISTNTPTYSIIIGDGAGKNLAGGTKITAIGKDALYSLGLDGDLGFEDFAIGPGALYNLRYGNYNTSFGFSVGQILKNACFENTFCGHNISTYCYSKPINSSLYSNGNQINVNTFILPSMPTSPALYAGCRVMTHYSGNVHYSVVNLINPTTRGFTLNNNISVSNNTYVYFFENGQMKATYVPPTTVITTGAQMTISTGLNIAAGYLISYQENATFMSTVVVVSYNSSTGLLSLSSNITVLGSTTMYFSDTSIDVNLGYDINNNTVIGSQNFSRICSGASGNTIIGQNAMAANEGSTSKNYLGGSNNTAIGINAGNASFMTNNCTFIGANAGTTLADSSKLTHSCAIGADAKISGNYQIVIGSSADDVIISKQLSMRNVFYPYSVRTILTANIVSGVYSFPTNAISGTNIVNAQVASILITMPATISTAMVGCIITFRNINQGTPSTTVVNVNYASGTNKIYYQTNGVLSTTGTAQAPLLTSTKSIATMRCISTTEWTIDQ